MKNKVKKLSAAQTKHAIKCLKKVRDQMGSNRKLAAYLGTSDNNVANWIMGRAIPVRYIFKICLSCDFEFNPADFNPIIFK